MASAERGRLEIPDLTQAVTAVITTFAAFVGISLTDFFDETKNRLGEELRFWAFLALVALLLRYIIGSAVHLNRAYGSRKGGAGPLLPSIPLFIKDLLFLVLFGYVAIRITHSHKFVHFMQEAAWFVGLGLAWSLSDWGFRRVFLPASADHKALNQLAGLWIAIDAGQLALTGLLALWLGRGLWTAILLAAVYVIVFVVDMAVLLHPRHAS